MYFGDEWLALEGVITHKKYLNAIKAKFSDVTGRLILMLLRQVIYQSFPCIGMENPLSYRVKLLCVIMVCLLLQMTSLQRIVSIGVRLNNTFILILVGVL